MRVLFALLLVAGVSSSPSPGFSRGRVHVCGGVRCNETAPDCFKPIPSRHHKVPDDIIYCDNAETLCRYPVRKLIGSGEFDEVFLVGDVGRVETLSLPDASGRSSRWRRLRRNSIADRSSFVLEVRKFIGSLLYLDRGDGKCYILKVLSNANVTNPSTTSATTPTTTPTTPTTPTQGIHCTNYHLRTIVLSVAVRHLYSHPSLVANAKSTLS